MKNYNPLPYYGGKYSMLKELLPLVDIAREQGSKILIEPFCGGACVTWNSHGFKKYVINDIFDDLINFYGVVKTDFDKLIAELDLLPHSRAIYQERIKNSKTCTDPIGRAVDFYYLMFSFVYKYKGGFSTTTTKNEAKAWLNRKKNIFNLVGLLDNVTIENIDYLRIIDKYDSERTLFYVDPPYPNTYQGHYEGYTQEDFSALLDKLEGIKGRFILSCYSNNLTHNNFSFIKKFKKVVTAGIVGRGTIEKKFKEEAIIGNFKLACK